MNQYSDLLNASISFIQQVEEEKEVQSLFKSGGTTALTEKIKGSNDFELITFFMVV